MHIEKYNTNFILSFFIALTICMQNPIWIFGIIEYIIGYSYFYYEENILQ